MTRIQLRIYLDPGEAEVIVNFARAGNIRTYRTVGTVDTGAEICLMPLKLLQHVEHRIISEEVTIEQAGIAQQNFTALEAEVRLSLEDQTGNQTRELTVRAWFARTDQLLLGFRDLLEHAVLHIDMPGRDGWIEIA